MEHQTSTLRSARGITVLPALLALITVGCQGPYLVRQLAGGVHLLARARPVDEVLADTSGVDADVRRGLSEVKSVLDFARAQGLDVGNAYRTYVDLEGRPPVWVLFACPPDRLAPVSWRFPLIGSFPYKGFFDADAALREQRQLESKGLETLILPGAAYSLLGWFPDPVLSSFLEEGAGLRAETLFHELTHRTVFIRGDVAFNESLASFVGELLARRFLIRELGPESTELAEYESHRHDRQLFNETVRRVREQLEEAFLDESRDARLAARQRILGAARQRVATLPWRTDRYRSIPERSWGLPLVLSVTIYHGRREHFRELLEHCQGDVGRVLHTIESLDGEPDAATSLERWLREHAGE